MKSVKPIMLVLAGVLIIGATVAFKAEEPKKEYCQLSVLNGYEIDIIKDDKLTTEKIPKSMKMTEFTTQKLNQLANENWQVISVYSDAYRIPTYVLERTKQ